MSQRTFLTRLALLGFAALLVSRARPADAYVIVTSDNKVYQVESKPELHGDLLLFTLAGEPVSLRVYDVNLAKTNEFNHMMEGGGSADSVRRAISSLHEASPVDERIIASSGLHVAMDPDQARAVGALGNDYESDRAAARYERSRESSFSNEARSALDEADRRVRNPPPAPSSSGQMTARESAKASDLDAEIAAEQEYLRKLTGGEMTVADLDGEIDRTMDKIRRLQKRRGDLGSAPSSSPASTYTPTGNWPAGSREAKWEEELSQLQGELGRLKSQQSASSGASDREREALDERVGETQYRIQRLESKLQRAGRP